MLSELAKQQLGKAGWYEGRKIDLTEYEKGYAELGLDFFRLQESFLKSLATCIYVISMFLDLQRLIFHIKKAELKSLFVVRG